MPSIIYKSHHGATQEVHAEACTSILQAAADNSIDGILGECGGCCSCATCHCYIDLAWVAPHSTEKTSWDAYSTPKKLAV